MKQLKLSAILLAGMFALSLFSPIRKGIQQAIATNYNKTIRLVSSAGTVMTGGVASGTTANYDETVRVVNDSGNVISALSSVNYLFITNGASALNSTNIMTNFIYIGVDVTVNKINVQTSNTAACSPAPTLGIVDCGTSDPSAGALTAFCSSTTPITSSGSTAISVVPPVSGSNQVAPITWTGTLTLTHGHYYAGRITGAGTSCSGTAFFHFAVQGTV